MADETLFKHGHEEEVHSQKADSANWDNDWDEINKKREEIKAMKEKQRISKLEAEEYGTAIVDEDTQHKIEESHNQWKDTHERKEKVIKADTSKWDNDWDTINKQREEIKAIKQKQRIAKLEAEEYGTGTPIVDEETQHRIEESHNKWKDTHERQDKVIKADNTKWDNDWDTINKQREEIKAIKQKQRLAKLAKEQGDIDEATQQKIEKSHNKWKDSHARNSKVIKADNSKWDNDWETINAKRAEIKAIKEKKRLSKLQSQNELMDRNMKKKQTDKKFKNAHDRKDKVIKADTSKWDNDWDKINAKRAEIKAIKEKKRLSKLQSQNDLMDRNKNKKQTDKKYKNAHDKKPKKIAAKERVGTDWTKIEKQRAEIKALKEKKRREKAEKAAAEEEAQTARARTASKKKAASKKKKATQKKKTKKKKRTSSSEDSSQDDSQYDVHDTTFGNMHEKDNKVIKADTSKWDNDWDKINAKRAEIKAIKAKKRLSKLQSQNELMDRNKNKKQTDKKYKNAHDKKPKKIAAKERVGTDWDKIEKQRAEIKALKAKKRQQKLQAENELKDRNKNKKDTDKKYKNAHDKKPKKMAAKERVGTDWDKIEKQRAEIRALKEKRRREKEQGGPKKVTTTFGNPHEQ